GVFPPGVENKSDSDATALCIQWKFSAERAAPAAKPPAHFHPCQSQQAATPTAPSTHMSRYSRRPDPARKASWSGGRGTGSELSGSGMGWLGMAHWEFFWTIRIS